MSRSTTQELLRLGRTESFTSRRESSVVSQIPQSSELLPQGNEPCTPQTTPGQPPRPPPPTISLDSPTLDQGDVGWNPRFDISGSHHESDEATGTSPSSSSAPSEWPSPVPSVQGCYGKSTSTIGTYSNSSSVFSRSSSQSSVTLYSPADTRVSGPLTLSGKQPDSSSRDAAGMIGFSCAQQSSTCPRSPIKIPSTRVPNQLPKLPPPTPISEPMLIKGRIIMLVSPNHYPRPLS